MRPSPILLAAVVLSSAPAFAGTETSHANASTASKPAPSTASPDRKYCIAPDETTTGTRLRIPECLTKAEWARRGVDIDELTKQQ
jgi:hypothetical protein